MWAELLQDAPAKVGAPPPTGRAKVKTFDSGDGLLLLGKGFGCRLAPHRRYGDRQACRYVVRELPAEARPPILKAYLDRFTTEVQRFFPVPKGSAVEGFVSPTWRGTTPSSSFSH